MLSLQSPFEDMSPAKTMFEFEALIAELPPVETFIVFPGYCPTRVHQYTWVYSDQGLAVVHMQVYNTLTEKIVIEVE